MAANRKEVHTWCGRTARVPVLEGEVTEHGHGPSVASAHVTGPDGGTGQFAIRPSRSEGPLVNVRDSPDGLRVARGELTKMTTHERTAPAGAPPSTGATGRCKFRDRRTNRGGPPEVTGRLPPEPEPPASGTAPRVEMVLPCSYELPVSSTRILASILLAEMRSRDRRPPEAA